MSQTRKMFARPSRLLTLNLLFVMTSCSAQTTSTGTGTTGTTTGAADTTAGIKAAKWGSNVTVTLSDTTFRYQSDGKPNHALPTWFLVPKEPNNQPFKNKAFADFTVYRTSDFLKSSPIDVTLPLKPSFASAVQKTNLGQIGFAISGARIFNDYENMELTNVALDDNISFPVNDSGEFDETGHDHAAFVDSCNGHPLANGSSYHYHGIPTCVAATVDVAGEHSHILGVLRDGFPVYGDKGEKGVTLTNADLDECSGHVGATPEFPDGIYHYHLTADKAPYSVDCYKGSVDAASGDSAGGPGGPPPGNR